MFEASAAGTGRYTMYDTATQDHCVGQSSMMVYAKGSSAYAYGKSGKSTGAKATGMHRYRLHAIATT